MYFVITIPKVDSSYMSLTNRLANTFQSMAVLNSIACSYDWVTPTCLVTSFSSSFLSPSVVEDRLANIFSALHFSLPENQVSDVKTSPCVYFRFLNITVSLKSKI